MVHNITTRIPVVGAILDGGDTLNGCKGNRYEKYGRLSSDNRYREGPLHPKMKRWVRKLGEEEQCAAGQPWTRHQTQGPRNAWFHGHLQEVSRSLRSP